jgi:hypothetical protein
MKFTMLCVTLMFSLSGLLSLFQNAPQDKTTKPLLVGSELDDEISDLSGVYVRDSDWGELVDVAPSRVRVKHGILHALTYGTVPADTVAEYDGAHAEIRVTAGRPIFCICLPQSSPTQPAVVKLHNYKDTRLFNAGRLPVLGAIVAEAKESDLVPIDVHRQPKNMGWLLQPRLDLPPGEYAVMLGTQNLDVFPFTLTDKAAKASAPTSHDKSEPPV